MSNVDFDDAVVKLSDALRIIDITKSGEEKRQTIAVGIEAHHLFGKKTGVICSHLMNCQNLFGTTVWWSGQGFFKDALQEQWRRRDFTRARNWIQTFLAYEGSPSGTGICG